MQILWIILGVIGLAILAVIIYSVLWVLIGLKKKKFTQEYLDEETKKADERIRQNDERIRRNDERLKWNDESVRRYNEMIAKGKKASKDQRVLDDLIARNIFTESEMKEITVLANRGNELLKNDTEMVEPIIELTEQITKMIKRETTIISTFREKKRDELQPELDELGAKIREMDIKVNELEVQQQERQTAIVAMRAEITKWIELGQSRLS